MKSESWSEEEILFLRLNYEEMADDELGKILNRTILSIRGKRQELRLLKKRNKGQFEKIPMPPKEKLEELYLELNKTPTRISEIFHVSSNTVRRWLDEYNIQIKRPYTSYIESNLSETEKAYFAGYLDGDGTINFGVSKNKKSRTGYALHYDISLVSKNGDFIRKLQNIIGGKINSYIYEDSRRKKEVHRLGFRNQASGLSFLKAIFPYLILKKRQAELMIRFFEERLYKRRKGNAVIISDELWGIAKEIGRLNQT